MGWKNPFLVQMLFWSSKNILYIIDMKDHINIYSKSKTKLGRMLSNFYRCNVSTRHGHFVSVEGYWYWLSTRDDTLRNLWGYRAKKYGRSVRGQDWVDSPDFKQNIKYAITNKIIENTDIYDLFVKSTLPFDHYYVYSGKIVRPDSGQWIIDHITALRDILQT